MTFTEAREIAVASECGENLMADRGCNEGTKTFWIKMTTKKPGCNPTCVVDAESRRAGINWMCTGLILP
jgi:hypothetical protein